MAIISSQTVVTIADALDVTTVVDFVLQPENAGINVLRELRYPNDDLPPIIYEQNPDRWQNFDTSPLVKRPQVAVQQTLEDNRMTGWRGFDKDAPIVEIWEGSDTVAPMTLSFFRQLHAYYENPPESGFITWSPKDRTATVYNILIQTLTVGGQGFRFDYVPSRQGFLTQDVTFTFRIVGEV